MPFTSYQCGEVVPDTKTQPRLCFLAILSQYLLERVQLNVQTKKSSQEDGVRCLVDFLQHPNHFHRWQFCNVWCSILLGGKTVHQVSWQVFPHSMALFYVNSSAVTLYATPPELSSWSKTLSTLHSSDHEHFFNTLSINWMTLLLSKCPKGVKFSKKRIHQSVLLFLRKAHQTSILWLATDLPHKKLFFSS